MEGVAVVVKAEPAVDGRRARKERGRLAVTDAMIDLVLAGTGVPTSEEVAERAGVSVASLFRYFDTLDDLRQATTQLYFERYSDLFDIPNIGTGSLKTRIESLVSARVALYETVEPMARLVRWRAGEIGEADEIVHQVRASRADQIRLHFAAELAQRTPTVASNTAMIIATLTSFESWEHARHDHNRSPAQVRRAWAHALQKVLAE